MDRNHLIARCGEGRNVLNYHVAKGRFGCVRPWSWAERGKQLVESQRLPVSKAQLSLVHHTFSTKPPKRRCTRASV
jgi:hypothetical protein